MELANLSANLLSPLKAVDRHPVTVAPSTCLGDAIALMRGAIDPCPLPNSAHHSNETVKASISCVLVVDENQLVGLLSPEDVLNWATEYGWQGMKVADAMTRNLIVLKESEFTDTFTAFKLFCQHSIDYLPIVDERGQVVGLVSEKRIRPAMYSWIEALQQEAAKLQEKCELLDGNCELEKRVSDRKNAENALRQSEARYRAIVEDQSELICRYLPDGKITFVNQAYCRYFGVQPEDLLGNSFMPLIPEADREIFQDQYTSVSPDKPIFTGEHRVILPSGEIGWQQWIDRAIFDESGQIVEYQAQGRDVTQLKQAEIALLELNAELERRVQQRTQWYELAVSAGKVGVWDWNLETDEIYIAPSLKALLGYQDAEIPNRMENWASHVHPDDRVAVWEAVKAYLEGVTEIYEVEHRMLRKDGSTCWILARGSAIRSADGKACR
ncbi:MAG: PAS domain-containing protein, partial [Microcoleus sp. T3-bin5]|nr:PAS domain-containing protein [Microcoleus sp. T3-bin5]